MNYATLESDIVTLLTTWLAADEGVPVDVFTLPNDVSNYKLAFGKPVVYVCFQKSEFTPPKSTGSIIQHEQPQVAVMIEARNRDGAGGIFDTFERCRMALMNNKTSHSSAIFVKEIKFAEYKDQVWSYDFCVTCHSVAVAYVPLIPGPPALPPEQQNTDNNFN